MTLMRILETLLIGPLKLFFEIVFVIAERVVGSPGLAIIALSLLVNILLLPLYKRVDAIQEQTQQKEAELKPGVDHIKKMFSGDERMMILQTYYRQNHYRPTDALNGSVSLLLEVPFFMAAYQFLSNLSTLEGVAFGPIADLGAPDGMLMVGMVAVNVLPITMTVINLISGTIYAKGQPLKSKIQMYGLALVFLVLLYDSPSGLVFYWTLNNLFSLFKNIFTRVKNSARIGRWMLWAMGIALLAFGLLFYHPYSIRRKQFVVVMGVLLMLPQLWALVRHRIRLPEKQQPAVPNGKLWFEGCVFLTLLTGMLIPSTVIAASAQEFVDISYFHDPNLYVLMSTCIAAGIFLVWMGVFYWLADRKAKVLFGRIVWVLCGVMLVNYMFFGRNLGILDTYLKFENSLVFSTGEIRLNLVVMALLIPLMYLVVRKWERFVVPVVLTAAIAIGCMSVMNMVSTSKQIQPLKDAVQTQSEEIPTFNLSKDGKNVVVLMLDRAPGYLLPYLFAEKPELQEQYDGFVLYSNTLSHGRNTLFATPALYGGYEYTPVEMNKRDQEPLAQKQNEALLVLPVLFSEEGYEATTINPVYVNYHAYTDLSIFQDYPGIRAYSTDGIFEDDAMKQARIEMNYRNFFCYSLMKSAPVIIQKTIYCGGNYNQSYSERTMTQTFYTPSTAAGLSSVFMNEYAALSNMENMTQIVQGEQNTFLIMANDTTHSPVLLQAPDYVPAAEIDNREYDAEHPELLSGTGITRAGRTEYQITHYHINMAAMLQLGRWFDYLRENGVYDNTRIILVGDHGVNMDVIDEMLIDNGEGGIVDIGRYNPLLLVKDFGSTGFSISQTFMTNADVPTLTVSGLIEDPVNPFTGKQINSDEKLAHDQMVFLSAKWDTTENNGNVFLPDTWASVSGPIRDAASWRFYNEETVLTEHALP